MGPITDQEEFLQLIQDNKGIIIRICNMYCPDKNDREDLAQEVIYQLWKSGNSFNTDHRFTTWMYRVALNVAISFYRSKKRSGALIAFTEDHPDIEDPAGEQEEMEEAIQRLQERIRHLKELDRALMILYLESKTYKEIADIMGITETNVATKISRIKEKLKRQLLAANHL